MSIFEIAVIVCFVILWLTVVMSGKSGNDEHRPELDGFKSLQDFQNDNLKYENQHLLRENRQLRSELTRLNHRGDYEFLRRNTMTATEVMEALNIEPPCPEPKEFKVEGTLKIK